MSGPEVEPLFVQSPPRAIRVKTSAGWADLAIQGPPGPTGAASTVPGPAGPTGPTGAQGAPGVSPPDPALIVDAKGDILAGTADNVLARVPVGANGNALIADSTVAPGVKWGPAGSDLIYDGDFAAGPTYKDGEIVVSNGVAYICVTPTTAPPAAWPGGPTPAPTAKPAYGTTFPASPVDGQEAVLTDYVPFPAYVWRLRYNALRTSDSAYKWEFVGGAPRSTNPGGSVGVTTANAWTAITSSSTIGVPRTGRYLVNGGCFVQHMGTWGGAINCYVRVFAYIGSGAVTASATFVPTGQYGGTEIAIQGKLVLTANDTLRVEGQINSTISGQVNFSNAWLRLTPEALA